MVRRVLPSSRPTLRYTLKPLKPTPSSGLGGRLIDVLEGAPQLFKRPQSIVALRLDRELGGLVFSHLGAFQAPKLQLRLDAGPKNGPIPDFPAIQTVMSAAQLPAKVRKFAQGIVATCNHLSVSIQRTSTMVDIDLQPSRPDEFSDILTDVCAVMARIILLAPPERQREMCALVLSEVNDIVEHILDVNNLAPH
jgi:hypothetical protein